MTMHAFWQLTRISSRNSTLSIVLGLPSIFVLVASDAQRPRSTTGAHSQALPPFLDLFKKEAERPHVISESKVSSAVGEVRGILARPASVERLPAILLLPGEAGLNTRTKQNAKDLCGIGYVVLALDVRPGRPSSKAPTQDGLGIITNEAALAQMSAAVRWLRRRPDVMPDRVGVLGLSEGASQALALASSTPLQACVVCDGVLSPEPALLAGLRRTPLLAIFAGQDESTRHALPTFRKLLADAQIRCKIITYNGASTGFIELASDTPAGQAGDAAWVEIYEFLGKHVEDASANQAPTIREHPPQSVATIADIMRAINGPTGVRGELVRLLSAKPTDDKQWKEARACAALMVEAGSMLEKRTPPRGMYAHWVSHARAFVTAAGEVVTAVDQRDYEATQRGLKSMKACCAECHEKHR
jgi:carboxymethylenebutenolidase